MKVLGQLLIAVLLVAVIAAITVPLINIRRIQVAIASAESKVESAVHLDAAIASLRMAEKGVYSFPVLAHNLNVALVSAYTASSRLQEAEERAEWLRSTRDMQAGYGVFAKRPTGPIASVMKLPNTWCYKLVARGNTHQHPFSWDRWTGYRTMLVQLDRDATSDEYARLARRIEELDSDGTFPRSVVRTTVVKASESKEIARNLHNLRVYDDNIKETKDDEDRNTDFVSDRAEATEQALPAWAVVKTPTANLFSVRAADQGKSLRVGEVPAGTAVEITRIFTPRSMTLAICRLASGKYKGKSAILKYETLAAFPGALADAAERQPVLESTKVRLLLHIDKLKDGARQRKKNVPAVRRYLDAEKKHKAFYAEITELMKIVDEEIEGDRMKAQDRLRRMKYEQSKEDKNFENAKSIYLEWRERQREEDSPELAKAKQRLAEIESELGSLEADG